jgi:hypothetical protein
LRNSFAIFGDKKRILCGISWDFTSGGGESAFRAVEHFVDGIKTRRIVGMSADASGRASWLSTEDAQGFADIAAVKSSKGFETVLLHIGSKHKALRNGFVAGLIPVNKEEKTLLASLFRRTRALLLVEGLELVLTSADFCTINQNAMKILSAGAPTDLPEVPIWKTDRWPLTVAQMER